MSANYVLLETIQLTQSAVASVTFDNIPQTGYTDLKVLVSARSTRTGTDVDDELRLTFNSIATGYTTAMIEGTGDGTAPRSVIDSNGVRFGRGTLPTDNATANTFGNTEIYIPQYRGSANKTISMDTVSETNANFTVKLLTSGVVSASSAAITSITFTAIGTFDANSTFSLFGIADVNTTPTVAPLALGGNIIAQDGTYWYHAFTSSGTFTPDDAITADVLVVAGGGGTSQDSGGGGAGGLLTFSSESLLAIPYTVSVGAGGTQSTGTNDDATSGVNSQFGSLTASVGGGRARYRSQNPVGGSGAGGNSNNGGGVTTPASGTAGQGNAGGTADFCTGGGGGAGGVGGNASGSTIGGTGGIGATSSLINAMGAATLTGQLSGGNYYYAGGGAGWYGGPAAGLGGGGAQSSNGTANTGGGAGAYRGNGGSGIVIVRYPMSS